MSGSTHRLSSGRAAGAASGCAVAPPVPRARDRLCLLAEAIEAEILPRLLGGHPPLADAALPRPRLPVPGPAAPLIRAPLILAPVPQAAMDLAALVLGADEHAALAVILAAVARHGLEPVCLELLAPAARHLGDLWLEDICSFADVTIGLMRLQRALLGFTVPAPETAAAAGSRTILLAPAPGDQHRFGITMVAGFLERAGWRVTRLPDGAPPALEAALRSGWYAVLGLSAGSAARLPALAAMLPRLRAISRNPHVAIMVGGPLFTCDPGLAAAIGADGTAADGAQAVHAAEALAARQLTAPQLAAQQKVSPGGNALR
jgi:methanogenic corrinoid protein MtbC1